MAEAATRHLLLIERQPSIVTLSQPLTLFHFSEDPRIERFEPRISPSSPVQDRPLVWAVDGEHAWLYYFPRDCPRVCFAAVPSTTPDDRERFFAHSTAERVAAVEASWLSELRAAVLYRYDFASAGFALIDSGAGYWVTTRAVEPQSVTPVGDLLQALRGEGVELRIMPSLWPLYQTVVVSTLQFSIIGWRNAAPRPTRETFV